MVISSIRARIEDACKEVNQSFPECPFIDLNIIVSTGHPVDQIIHFAEKTDSDLVVMGSCGQGILAEAMLGSTSRRVLRRCEKPVMVVRLPSV